MSAAATSLRAIVALLACLVAAALLGPASAPAAPLSGSAFDTGDGDQVNGLGLDWEGGYGAGRVREAPDANDDCFVGGVKENTPDEWAFDTSPGGCTPGKSNIRVAYANPESSELTTFGHFAFFRNDTTGNTFLTFELNQAATSWTNATGATIPCRTNGDVLLSFEVGGSSLETVLYKWRGDGTGPAECPDGANGTFVGSGVIGDALFQGDMNASAAITNFVDPARYGGTFPKNSFGEAAIDLPAVLEAMNENPCFGFLQMQVHSRSSSSISSAMIDYTSPVPVYLQSCAATGTAYQDSDGDGTRDAGEPGLAGFEYYADLDGDGTRDAGEPAGTSDIDGFYRILDVPAGEVAIRQVARAGWRCTAPDPCSYTRSFVTGGNSTGNDFGNTGPATASGTKFNDLDADGTQDAAEPGLAGWTFYVDLDGDGARDAGEPSAVSGADGAWSIADVPSGTHAIREVAQDGWTCSTPQPCSATATFASGSSETGLAFGGWTTAIVAGRLYEDVDGDGAAKEAGDVDLAGWQVFVDADGDDTFDLGELQTTTDASGAYTIPGVPPGTATIRAAAGLEWYCAAACERSLTLTSGQLTGGHDLAFGRAATISGTKFDDIDNSGTRGGSEGPLQGFSFWVDYDGDNDRDAGEPAGTSDAAGAWTITGVRAGSWTLREEPNGAYACTRPSPCEYAVTLASGGTASGYEFGNYVSRSVSGVLFNDSDADGLAREVGEPGLEGWTVYSDANANGVLDAGEPSSVSNSVGEYRLTGLANGNYRIGIVAGSGWTCSFPSACQNTGSIGSGQSDIDRNFGVWGPSRITGTVFEDADADGTAREDGDAALPARVVYLDADGDAVHDAGEPSGTSDADGAYAIAGVNPGTYTVRQVLPAGWTCSRPSPCAYTVSVSSGDVGGRDFGSFTTGSIAGAAYEDADADEAAREAGEAGLGSRTIFLDADGDGSPDAGETTATTSADGTYALTGLAPGTYTVRQAVPAGWTAATAHTVTVASGDAVTGRDFGSFTSGAISGVVFEDSDFDGSGLEPGDPVPAGSIVYLDADGDGTRDAAEAATTTDASGAYTFAAVAPGTATVRVVLAADRACSFPAACSHEVDVTSRSSTPGRDFGSYLGASVTGTVFEDADADGAAREAGEAGVGDQRVYLDGNANAVRDAAEPSTLTDADGDYAFTGITAQSWQVRLELPAGWPCDRPSPCRRDLTLTSGSGHVDQDFGVHTTGSIAGHLFTDRDNDGGPQVFGENDQPGRTVYLDADDDGVKDDGERSATTDDRGDYTFAGLEPDGYVVRQVLPEDWRCSRPDPCRRTVTVTSRQAVTGQHFSSWTTASVTGAAFEDLDAGGDFPEAGDGGLDGRTVYLDVDGSGTLDTGEPTTTTAADGTYRFTGLLPGTHVVRTAPTPAAWTCSYPPACSTTITVEADESAQDAHFGSWTVGTVDGTVYADADGSGSHTAGEGGLAGRTVFADLDDDGVADAGEPSDRTDAAGAYALTLDPATHTIRQVAPAGWTCTDPSPCARTATVTSSGAVTGQDFGMRADPAQVSGIVYDDADADGAAREPGETALAGVTVYVDLDDDGVSDDGGPSATTDAEGAYTLTGLAPGTSHAIRVVDAAGRTCSRPDACVHRVTPGPGAGLTGLDFGSWAPATIAGRWWDDRDGDGVTGEAGEGGHAGQTLYADADGDGTRVAGEATATTAADGTYTLVGLRPGAVLVRADLGVGHRCTTACARTVTVASGQAATDVDVASVVTATVAGTVFDDADRDGTIGEAGEGGRAGVRVYLDADDDGAPDPGESSVLTDAGGAYVLPVMPGAFVVRLEPAAGITCSFPTPCVRTGTVVTAGALTGQDFGVRLPAPAPEPPSDPGPAAPPAPPPTLIAGAVFEDRDGDGSGREAGEPGLAGWTVYHDANRNGARDGGEPATTTDTHGRYTVSGWPPGRYALRFVAPSATWVCSVPAACVRRVTLTPGAQVGGLHLGGWRKARVSGYKFEDADRDGSAREQGDRPLEGWTIFADLNRNRHRDAGEPFGVTDADGRYGLTNMPLGTVVLRELRPDGSRYRCTFPVRRCATKIRLSSSAPEQTADFGAVRGIRRASRRARLNSPARCRTGRFRLRVRAKLARRVVLRVDGRRHGTRRKSSRGRFTFRLHSRRYRRGVHRVTGRVTFLDGSRRTVRGTFYRCARARPRFTG